MLSKIILHNGTANFEKSKENVKGKKKFILYYSNNLRFSFEKGKKNSV